MYWVRETRLANHHSDVSLCKVARDELQLAPLSRLSGQVPGCRTTRHCEAVPPTGPHHHSNPSCVSHDIRLDIQTNSSLPPLITRGTSDPPISAFCPPFHHTTHHGSSSGSLGPCEFPLQRRRYEMPLPLYLMCFDAEEPELTPSSAAPRRRLRRLRCLLHAAQRAQPAHPAAHRHGHISSGHQVQGRRRHCRG